MESKYKTRVNVIKSVGYIKAPMIYLETNNFSSRLTFPFWRYDVSFSSKTFLLVSIIKTHVLPTINEASFQFMWPTDP